MIIMLFSSMKCLFIKLYKTSFLDINRLLWIGVFFVNDLLEIKLKSSLIFNFRYWRLKMRQWPFIITRLPVKKLKPRNIILIILPITLNNLIQLLRRHNPIFQQDHRLFLINMRQYLPICLLSVRRIFGKYWTTDNFNTFALIGINQIASVSFECVPNSRVVMFVLRHNVCVGKLIYVRMCFTVWNFASLLPEKLPAAAIWPRVNPKSL